MNGFETIRPISGGSLEAGKAYHDVVGVSGPSFRSDTAERVARILSVVEVEGRRGVDIGCSVGGISFGLAAAGAEMVGVDYDATAVEFAQGLADDRSASARFVYEDITELGVWHDLCTGGFDFAVWLSNWMWVAKQAGVERARDMVVELADSVPVLVFETAESENTSMAGAGGIGSVSDVEELLLDGYESVTWVGVEAGWHRRSMFLATNGGR